jgi:hypothetical protein
VVLLLRKQRYDETAISIGDHALPRRSRISVATASTGRAAGFGPYKRSNSLSLSAETERSPGAGNGLEAEAAFPRTPRSFFAVGRVDFISKHHISPAGGK